MAEYFVRTNSDRVFSVAADRYQLDPNGNAYDFVKDGKTVASFNSHSVLAVIEEDAHQGEFSPFDDDEDGTDDVCLGCRFNEFLESEEFYDAVSGIVNGWHDPVPDAPPAPENPPGPYPIEHWKTDDDEVWGIQTKHGFVHWPSKEDAEEGRQYVIADRGYGWCHQDLTGYTKVED
jgi:hypothetical protein